MFAPFAATLPLSRARAKAVLGKVNMTCILAVLGDVFLFQGTAT